jgi:hypothetical protein
MILSMFDINVISGVGSTPYFQAIGLIILSDYFVVLNFKISDDTWDIIRDILSTRQVRKPLGNRATLSLTDKCLTHQVNTIRHHGGK